MTDDLLHAASSRITVPAREAFAFLADARNLARWATGLREQVVVAPGLVRGMLGADGRETWCRVDPAAGRDVITYRLGGTPDTLLPRIVAIVMAGGSLGRGDGECVVSLLAWRTADMTDARWAGLREAHEAEVRSVRQLLEAQRQEGQRDRRGP